MNTIGDRIRLRRKDLGLTQADLGRSISVSAPAISQLEKGDSKSPSSDNLLALSRALSCSPEWLQTGTSSSPAQGSEHVTRNTNVPVLDVELSAGFGVLNHSESVLDTLPIPEQLLLQMCVPAAHARIVRVRGDSMEPTLHNGELVVINTNENQPISNKLYAFEFEGELKVKRFTKEYSGLWRISSDNEFNPAYKDQTISPQNISQLRIIGRVAGLMLRNL